MWWCKCLGSHNTYHCSSLSCTTRLGSPEWCVDNEFLQILIPPWCKSHAGWPLVSSRVWKSQQQCSMIISSECRDCIFLNFVKFACWHLLMQYTLYCGPRLGPHETRSQDKHDHMTYEINTEPRSHQTLAINRTHYWTALANTWIKLTAYSAVLIYGSMWLCWLDVVDGFT